MQVTIDLSMLLDVLLILMLTSSTGTLLYLKWRQRNTQRELQRSFDAAPSFAKKNLRYDHLHRKPLSEYQRLYPKDLRAVLQIVKTQDDAGAVLHVYHVNGTPLPDSWTAGFGLEVTELFRDTLVQLEQRKPGLIRVLQPMLDTAAEDLKHEAQR